MYFILVVEVTNDIKDYNFIKTKLDNLLSNKVKEKKTIILVFDRANEHVLNYAIEKGYRTISLQNISDLDTIGGCVLFYGQKELEDIHMKKILSLVKKRNIPTRSLIEKGAVLQC